MTRRILLPLLLLAALVPAAAFVRSVNQAGSLLRRTDNDNIRFLLNEQTVAGLMNNQDEVTISPGSDTLTAARTATGNWNGIPTADLNFVQVEMTSFGADPMDGNHVLVAVDTPENRSAVGGALAVARTFSFQDGRITDTDIIFNPTETFSTTGEEGAFDFESVATHEMGHTLGASHTHVRAASMFPRTGPAETTQSRLTDDDVSFATLVYPMPGAENNVGTISGTASLSGGGPATGVLVTAVDSNTGVSVGALSDLQDGTYRIEFLPPGMYYLTAEAANQPFFPSDLPRLDQASFNTNIKDTFFGGNENPGFIQLNVGEEMTADITVEEGAQSLDLAFFEAAPEDQFPQGFGDGVANLAPGETHDILVGGDGIDVSITIDDVRVLAPGVTVREVGLVENVMVGPFEVLRVRVDVAEAAGFGAGQALVLEPRNADPFASRAVGTFAIVKDGEAVLYTGGVVTEGVQAEPPRPEVTQDFVLNAASGALVGEPGHAVAPGSIISIFGSRIASETPGQIITFNAESIPLPTSLGGVSVTFDGVTAPLFGVFGTAGFDQINAQLPWEVAAGSAQVVVIRNGVASEPVQVQVAPASPGIFAFSGQGSGPAIVQNFSLDGDDVMPGSFAQPAGFLAGVTGQPAPVGGVIIIFANGLGNVENAPETGNAPGEARNVQQQVRVLIGGEEAEIIGSPVLHATLVGLNQINAFVPNVPPGDAVPIQLEINGVVSRDDATIAIREAP